MVRPPGPRRLRRLGQRSITFNHSEDTLETARLHIDPADYSCRKRQRRLGTGLIKGSRPSGQLLHRTMPARPLHRVVPDRVE
jgi:hypothetical protein